MIAWRVLVCVLVVTTIPPALSNFLDKLVQNIDKLSQKMLEIETCGQPRIANMMENITVKPGDKAEFNCKVDMSCMVSSIKWYHEMENGTEHLIKTASDAGEPNIYIIKKVSTRDTGLYTCVAKNVLGKSHAAAYLAVNQSSKLSSFPMVSALLSSLLLLLAS